MVMRVKDAAIFTPKHNSIFTFKSWEVKKIIVKQSNHYSKVLDSLTKELLFGRIILEDFSSG